MICSLSSLTFILPGLNLLNIYSLQTLSIKKFFSKYSNCNLTLSNSFLKFSIFWKLLLEIKLFIYSLPKFTSFKSKNLSNSISFILRFVNELWDTLLICWSDKLFKLGFKKSKNFFSFSKSILVIIWLLILKEFLYQRRPKQKNSSLMLKYQS